mgnify:CR=1 FL=1
MKNNDIKFTTTNFEAFKIEQRPKPKSKMFFGNNLNFVIYIDKKFNKLQKKMWKILLGIEVEDLE